MNARTDRTWIARKEDFENNQKWWLVDAEGQTLGRLATQLASTLRGKNKPTFTPHVDTGDCVVVVNAEKIRMTGNKMAQKKYYSHSGYFGSLKETTAEKAIETDPESIITEAVRGMLPKNKLATRIIKKLKVYQGTDHPHSAQKPEAVNVDKRNHLRNRKKKNEQSSRFPYSRNWKSNYQR